MSHSRRHRWKKRGFCGGIPNSPMRRQSKQSMAKDCIVCGQGLGIKGGMAATGLCGPCCTGEAATLSERGRTW